MMVALGWLKNLVPAPLPRLTERHYEAFRQNVLASEYAISRVLDKPTSQQIFNLPKQEYDSQGLYTKTSVLVVAMAIVALD